MIAKVIVDMESRLVDKMFEYACTNGVSVGDRVLVPFGVRNAHGFVWQLSDHAEIPLIKLKAIKQVTDKNIILPEMIELSKFMTEKYNLKIIDTIRLFLPSDVTKQKALTKQVYYLNDNYKTNMISLKKSAKNQFAIIKFLEQNGQALSSEINTKFGISSAKTLVQKGVLDVKTVALSRKPSVQEISNKNVTLTALQQSVVDKIFDGKNKIFLLSGVTGSGKTEVYMHSISKILQQNKTAIMLVPEISLTPQVMQNFVARFGDKVAILHSGLSAGERYDEWQRIKNGDAKIVVGARSAIFAPLENLGLIIIDEEHDTSYFSENNPRYFTHDVAKFRAKYNNCNLILGSATPSVEDYYKATTNEYSLIEMPVRVNSQSMPKMHIVDMLSELKNGNDSMFSNLLQNKLAEKINSKQQAILFLNRRGYNSFVMCRNCGYTAKCQDCDVSLVYHKEDNQLKCHYCGKRYHMLSCCPECKSTDIKYGAIGTQKVAEELSKLFPNVPVFRLDNDTVNTKNGHEQILHNFAKTKPSILVGTQMIAKGHDFPLVTLVGIIDADVSLHFSDYRANERTFNLITQVAGRAGRSELAGEVILQTYMPRHYVYRYASQYDYKKFFERELNLRKVTNFPPFAFVVRVLVSSENEVLTQTATRQLFDKISQLRQQKSDSFVFLGAMKSPVKKIEKKFRYQILMRLKPTQYDQIISQIFDICNAQKSKEVFVFVEQNPQNLS